MFGAVPFWFLPCLLLTVLLHPSDVPVFRLLKESCRQAGGPTSPVTSVTFLISSELFSMPPVKRFSVSFARHPTNGTSVSFPSAVLRDDLA